MESHFLVAIGTLTKISIALLQVFNHYSSLLTDRYLNCTIIQLIFTPYELYLPSLTSYELRRKVRHSLFFCLLDELRNNNLLGFIRRFCFYFFKRFFINTALRRFSFNHGHVDAPFVYNDDILFLCDLRFSIEFSFVDRIRNMSANPRKFSEKIALQQQKQAEGTAAYEQIMREVTATTRVRSTGLINVFNFPLTSSIRSNKTCFRIKINSAQPC